MGAGMDPFPERGLDEAFRLSVCLRRVRLCPNVFDAEVAAGSGPQFRFVARPIVGHDALDPDAEAAIVCDGRLQVLDSWLLLFACLDLTEGHPRVVVDSDVDVLPARRRAVVALVGLSAPIAGDAVAYGIETAELLDIDVDDLTGRCALIARPRLGWLKR